MFAVYLGEKLVEPAATFRERQAAEDYGSAHHPYHTWRVEEVEIQIKAPVLNPEPDVRFPRRPPR